MDRTKPFATLARVVATLAAGRHVTTPFAMGARDTEWSETFRVGIDRVTRERAVLLETTTRKGGLEHRQMADACFWSLGQMLEQVIEWTDEDFAAIEPMLDVVTPGVSPTVDAIAAFDDMADGASQTIAGAVWTLGRGVEAATLSMEPGHDPQWTLDDVVLRVMEGK